MFDLRSSHQRRLILHGISFETWSRCVYNLANLIAPEPLLIPTTLPSVWQSPLRAVQMQSHKSLCVPNNAWCFVWWRLRRLRRRWHKPAGTGNTIACIHQTAVCNLTFMIWKSSCKLPLNFGWRTSWYTRNSLCPFRFKKHNPHTHPTYTPHAYSFNFYDHLRATRQISLYIYICTRGALSTPTS